MKDATYIVSNVDKLLPGKKVNGWTIAKMRAASLGTNLYVVEYTNGGKDYYRVIA